MREVFFFANTRSDFATIARPQNPLSARSSNPLLASSMRSMCAPCAAADARCLSSLCRAASKSSGWCASSAPSSANPGSGAVWKPRTLTPCGAGSPVKTVRWVDFLPESVSAKYSPCPIARIVALSGSIEMRPFALPDSAGRPEMPEFSGRTVAESMRSTEICVPASKRRRPKALRVREKLRILRNLSVRQWNMRKDVNHLC